MEREDHKENPNPEDSIDDLSYISNVFQPSWIRCPIRFDDEVDRLILAYGSHILFPISLILWSLFFVFSYA